MVLPGMFEEDVTAKEETMKGNQSSYSSVVGVRCIFWQTVALGDEAHGKMD